MKILIISRAQELFGVYFGGVYPFVLILGQPDRIVDMSPYSAIRPVDNVSALFVQRETEQVNVSAVRLFSIFT